MSGGKIISGRQILGWGVFLGAVGLAILWLDHSSIAVQRAVAAEPDGSRSTAATTDAREAAVRRLVDRYFQSWSHQDMERYGRCFMPQAIVQLIDSDGRLISMPLGPFLRSQREAHEKAAQPMTETAERTEIRFEADLARVVVYWKLVEGQRVEYGYDHFTLMESVGEWRIANLIFYAKPTAKP